LFTPIHMPLLPSSISGIGHRPVTFHGATTGKVTVGMRRTGHASHTVVYPSTGSTS